MTSLPTLVLLLALGQFDDPPGGWDEGMDKPSHTQLHEAIVRNNYRRVGVLPRFIVREGAKETLGGSIGPQGDLFAEQLVLALSKSGRGRYGVVEERQMRKAFEEMTIDDLGDRNELARAAQKVGGLDALIVGTVRDLRAGKREEWDPDLEIQTRLIDVRSSTVAGATKDSLGLSLSDGAYTGESWELRRWSGNRMLNVGLRADGAGDAPGTPPLGAGALYESMQHRLIRRDLPHPLTNRQCPYRLAILVDNQQRPLARVGDRFYVALDPGDRYQIRVENRSTRAAYLSLFVDGINILGKKREHPAASRYWYLEPEGKFQFACWTTGSGGQYKQEEFIIAPADDSVAAGQGFAEQLGLITAVFYTVGMQDVPEAPGMYGYALPGTFGTGAGRESTLELQERSGPKPGLILAAITIYYTTSSRLEALKRTGS